MKSTPWTIWQSPVVSWIWWMRPPVPGGVARLAVMDDFGNLVQISIESASHSLS